MKNFYNNKTVLITGHTGFKGSWLAEILSNWGSNVIGYSLEAPTKPSLYSLLKLEERITSIHGDIRDYSLLEEVFQEHKPEIVIHMAAQPLVRESYKEPHYTYETNVMGTVNICECVRKSDFVKSFLNVTTDKVYENVEKSEGYSEDEKLDGFDPYSNSKSCSELVTHSYNNSFYKNMKIPCSTARAGNVIGGGDFATDRIIPDCVRAIENNEDIIIRNPSSIRPYQHVLESLNLYLIIMMKQFKDIEYAGYYNVGPDDSDCITTGDLTDLFCKYYRKYFDKDLKWINKSDNSVHEANFLKLDNSKIKDIFNWNVKWNIEESVDKTLEWTYYYINDLNIKEYTDKQIEEYFKC